MLFKIAAKSQREVQITPVVVLQQPASVSEHHHEDDAVKAELRRQMYERIAQGNALAEVEEKAQRQWNRR